MMASDQDHPTGFVAGTVVHGPAGTRPIESIVPGDELLCAAPGQSAPPVARKVVDVRVTRAAPVWYVLHKAASGEAFVMLGRHQQLAVMGRRDYRSESVLPADGYLGEGIVDGWLPALSFQFSASMVLESLDRRGADLHLAHLLFAMADRDRAWLQGGGGEDYQELMEGDVFDFGGAEPVRVPGNAHPNDLDLSTVPAGDIPADEAFPLFRRTLHGLKLEGENAFFVGRAGILVRGFD